ncbi:hypothetical protein [Mycobacterium arosiense]|uniref:Uncharacterized protein n=1 Tax=Mycobacterium arosiense ATCC BAA-1401 = DSM 45069 TaxID=1265311 RepID=A0A1W9ZBJ4_MYCAI|nr:hypothetical protein [Mycobacterium arosiense]ORA11377.1 hypothetical protein BST14_18725 [Mycobacterium arosiense ATCC BAA-1401 = DSM 45069]
MTTTETAPLDLLNQLTDDQCRSILRIIQSEVRYNQLKARLAHITLPEGWNTDDCWEECQDTERREIYGPTLGRVTPYVTQRGDGLYENEFVVVIVPEAVAPKMIWEISRSEALDLARKLIATCDEITRVVS